MLKKKWRIINIRDGDDSYYLLHLRVKSVGKYVPLINDLW